MERAFDTLPRVYDVSCSMKSSALALVGITESVVLYITQRPVVAWCKRVRFCALLLGLCHHHHHHCQPRNWIELN